MITILSTNKLKDDCYIVTVQDSLEVIGKTESNVDIYWTCSVVYNPANSSASLKKKIENVITARIDTGKEEDIVAVDIKEPVESIDTSTLGGE